MDMNEIVKGLVNDYIQPLKPIYRVSFVTSKVEFGEMSAWFTTKLVELNDKPGGDLEYGLTLYQNPYITSAILDEFQAKGFSERAALGVGDLQWIYTIVSVKRVA